MIMRTTKGGNHALFVYLHGRDVLPWEGVGRVANQKAGFTDGTGNKHD